ncbi:MAG TPA: hypothetical protein PK098_06715, partial [Phycisphaerales bacterium]|nr:hypothetical protein [Phycisphaerales bacterium]
MGDSFRKVQRGDPLRIPAEAFNAFIDAARAHRAGQHDVDGASGGDGRWNAGVVLVRNESGQARERFQVLAIDGPMFNPENALEGFKNRVVLKATTPGNDDASRFVILLEPLAVNAIGMACVSGVCPVKVDIKDEKHDFADVRSGQAGHLTSNSGGGGAQMIWKESKTGVRWAVVRLSNRNDVFPAEVTGHSTAPMGDPQWGQHAWKEVQWNEEEAEWEHLEGGRTGAVGTNKAAREVGGRPALRDGVIVLMHHVAGRYFFSADGGPVLELPLQGNQSNTRTLLDLDDEEALQNGYWFDRDHVHNGGPLNRHDDSVDPHGEHIKAFSGAVVFRVTYAEV